MMNTSLQTTDWAETRWAPPTWVSQCNAFLLSRVLVGEHRADWDELSPWLSKSKKLGSLQVSLLKPRSALVTRKTSVFCSTIRQHMNNGLFTQTSLTKKWVAYVKWMPASWCPGWSSQTYPRKSKGLPPSMWKGLKEVLKTTYEYRHGMLDAWQLNYHPRDKFSFQDLKCFSNRSELGTVFGHIISFSTKLGRHNLFWTQGP